MSTVIDVEHVVNERYGRAAHSREPELCCPVGYDPNFLNVIPDEIKERDYGCGDPSAFVREGAVVLDLASYTPTLAIIIPALNEARSIGATLDAVLRLSGRVEMIVVDGGSDDETREISSARGAKVITSERGRGVQMHRGACASQGGVLWFLHADTIVPVDAVECMAEALGDPRVVGGNFNVSFDGAGRTARFMTWLYPQLRGLGLCYGDSAIFVRREAYEQVGGFKSFPIFEDLDLMKRLRKQGRVIHLPAVDGSTPSQ